MPEDEGTLPDESTFRTVLGRLPTGVVIVTGGPPDAPSGLAVGSFMSVSLVPPLVAVCPATTSTSWPAIAGAGTFCANVLADGQEDIARRFAASGGDKFSELDWEPAPATGSPRLAGVAAWIDCTIYNTIAAGDHWLVLGEVRELAVSDAAGALVFHGGAFRQLL